MTRKEALTELLANVEAGEKSCIRAVAHVAFGGKPYRFTDGKALVAGNAYEGSLDAAKALHESVLPGYDVKITDTGSEYADIGQWVVKVNWQHMTWRPTFTAAGPFGYEGQSNDPARAWLIAILRALIAQEGGE